VCSSRCARPRIRCVGPVTERTAVPTSVPRLAVRRAGDRAHRGSLGGARVIRKAGDSVHRGSFGPRARVSAPSRATSTVWPLPVQPQPQADVSSRAARIDRRPGLTSATGRREVRLLSWSRRARSLDAAGQRAAAHARPGGSAQHRPLAIAVATLVPCRAGRWPSVAGFSPRALGEGRRPARARAVNGPTQLAHPFCEMSSRARWALLKPVGSGRPCAVVSPRGRRALGASQEVAPAAPQLATASYQTPPQVQALSSIRGDGPDRRAYSRGGPSGARAGREPPGRPRGLR